MSTGLQMMDWNPGGSDPEAVELTPNPSEAGPKPESVPYVLNLQESGRSPRGGIAYINPSAGGMANPRGDVFQRALNGIVGIRQRRAPFEGQFLGGTIVVPNRLQGFVGRRRNANALAVAAQETTVTDVPTTSEQVAGFFNPAAARALKKMKGGA